MVQKPCILVHHVDAAACTVIAYLIDRISRFDLYMGKTKIMNCIV